MDALRLIKLDHENMKNILDDLSNTTARAAKTREKLFMKLQQAIKCHEQAEEEVLYPALQEKERSIVLEALEEHRLADHVVELLDSTEFSDETWSAKFKVLKENMLHHIKEEEGNMFKQAKKHFDKRSLDDLGEEMEAYLK